MKGDSEAVCELRVLIDDSTCVCVCACSKFHLKRQSNLVKVKKHVYDGVPVRQNVLIH